MGFGIYHGQQLGYHRNERRANVFSSPRPSLVSSRPCVSTMNIARLPSYSQI